MTGVGGSEFLRREHRMPGKHTEAFEWCQKNRKEEGQKSSFH